MKLVFVLFDSLNRLALGPYGGTRLATPNFDRLAARAVTFDGHHVGSLPCMPARRDMQTGRLSFLHRSWGPLEPFDNAFPELLLGEREQPVDVVRFRHVGADRRHGRQLAAQPVESRLVDVAAHHARAGLDERLQRDPPDPGRARSQHHPLAVESQIHRCRPRVPALLRPSWGAGGCCQWCGPRREPEGLPHFTESRPTHASR